METTKSDTACYLCGIYKAQYDTADGVPVCGQCVEKTKPQDEKGVDTKSNKHTVTFGDCEMTITDKDGNKTKIGHFTGIDYGTPLDDKTVASIKEEFNKSIKSSEWQKPIFMNLPPIDQGLPIPHYDYDDDCDCEECDLHDPDGGDCCNNGCVNFDCCDQCNCAPGSNGAPVNSALYTPIARPLDLSNYAGDQAILEVARKLAQDIEFDIFKPVSGEFKYSGDLYLRMPGRNVIIDNLDAPYSITIPTFDSMLEQSYGVVPKEVYTNYKKDPFYIDYTNLMKMGEKDPLIKAIMDDRSNFVTKNAPRAGFLKGFSIEPRYLYISLHHGDPFAIGGGETYKGHMPVKVAKGSGSWKHTEFGMTNVDNISFPQCTGGGVVLTHFMVSDENKALFSGTLTDMVYISAGVTMNFAPGSLLVSLDKL